MLLVELSVWILSAKLAFIFFSGSLIFTDSSEIEDLFKLSMLEVFSGVISLVHPIKNAEDIVKAQIENFVV